MGVRIFTTPSRLPPLLQLIQMTRIDFYILAAGGDDRAPFACRLAEKAYTRGHRIYIHVADAAAAKRLDDLLWTFSDGSFLPHAVVDGGDPDPDTPVHIGFGPEPVGQDVLINLADETPLFFSRFERVAELVGGDEASRALARERYRFYRDRGYPLESHTIGSE